MAIQKVIEIVAETKDALKDIKELYNEQLGLQKDATNSQEKLNKEVENLGDSAKDSEKGIKSMAKGFKGVGLAIKALGIGLLLEGFSLLKDLFSRNQKVADAFSTSFEFVSIAFNDFIEFIFNNAGGVVDFFKAIFENPLQSIEKLGQLIKDNLIERFNSLLEVSGFLSDALFKLFEGDFAGAFDSVKKAGVESLDVLTGVDNVLDKTTDTINSVVDSVTNYTKATFEQAKANVELKNTAELAAAEQSRLVEIYDRQAEKLRQLRDDDSKSVSERIKSNEELSKVLDKQEKALIKQADLQIASAQANLRTNNTIENQVALTEALANKEGVLAQVEGLRSEQLSNRVALKREEIELNNSISDAEKERRLEQLAFEEGQQQTEALRIEKQREQLELENQLILEDIERKRELYAQGTQARVDAENEFALKSQQINNAIKQNEIDSNKEKEKSAKALEDSKIGLAEAGLGILSGLAKKGSALAKGVAVSQAVISTYQGINKALAETTDVTPTQTLRFANAAAVGIAGALNVAKILSTNEAGNTSAANPSVPSAPSAPSFNLVQGTGTNQIAEGLQGSNEPIKAFVVSDDVTTSQSLDRNIIDNASI